MDRYFMDGYSVVSKLTELSSIYLARYVLTYLALTLFVPRQVGKCKTKMCQWASELPVGRCR